MGDPMHPLHPWQEAIERLRSEIALKDQDIGWLRSCRERATTESAKLREELRARRACLVGAVETMEAVAETLENAENLDLARACLDVPVTERLALLQQAIDNTDIALGVVAPASALPPEKL